MGYRHIDTASLYGSETATGEALAEAFDSGLVRREEMFITSKVWCSEVDDVLSAIKRSLRYLSFMVVLRAVLALSIAFYGGFGLHFMVEYRFLNVVKNAPFISRFHPRSNIKHTI
mgnify:CR=1 FL=1